MAEIKNSYLNKIYEIDGFNYGLFDSFFRFVKKNPKLFVLMVTSLVLTFTLIIALPFLREITENALQKKKASKLNSLVYSFYSDLCSLKRNFLIENYVFIFFSAPLTCFLYFWNSFHLERTAKKQAKLKNSSNKKNEIKKKSVDYNENENSEFDQDSENQEPNEESSNLKKTKKNDDSLNKKKSNKLKCNIDLRLIVPMNPFAKNSRLITCIIYAAYIHNISKIFEFSMSDFDWIDLNKLNFNNKTNETSSFKTVINKLYKFQSYSVYGILVDLLLKILNVFIIGFHFYPVLLCVEFKRRSKLSFFLCSIYVWLLFVYYVFANELCKRDEVSVSEILKSIFGSAKEFFKGFF